LTIEPPLFHHLEAAAKADRPYDQYRLHELLQNTFASISDDKRAETDTSISNITYILMCRCDTRLKLWSHPLMKVHDITESTREKLRST